MTNARAVFHVSRWDGKWVVRQQGRPEGEYDCFETKEEAVVRARALADQQAPSLVKVE